VGEKMNQLIENLQIKKACYIGNTIFKKHFFENASMSKKDKEIFTKDVEKIIWQYALKEDNMRIPVYRDEEREYEEIAVIEVILSDNRHGKRIGVIVQATIPYPMILCFTFQNQAKLNLVNKRINQSDRSKNTLEEIIESEWIDFQNLTKRQYDFLNVFRVANCSFRNFYKFYLDVIERVEQLNISKITNDFEGIAKKDVTIIKGLQQKIEATENEIATLRSKLKKEVHFNRKMDLNIAIKRLEQKKQKLIDELGGEA
jgi:hypothetical protein